MITANIDINKNKLEEFVRVLLPEYYEILSEKIIGKLNMKLILLQFLY